MSFKVEREGIDYAELKKFLENRNKIIPLPHKEGFSAGGKRKNKNTPRMSTFKEKWNILPPNS